MPSESDGPRDMTRRDSVPHTPNPGDSSRNHNTSGGKKTALIDLDEVTPRNTPSPTSITSLPDETPLHQLPLDDCSEQVNSEPVGGRSSARAPSVIRSDQSDNWEDNYEQEEVQDYHHDKVFQEPPPKPETARSVGPSLTDLDLTTNPWLL
ncbi:hypothetical protein DXG03_000796 [Asterophora parasitica]|uniref:Uncharacterized protein n=1 Tax=Asterophora parasitica TaxID=117018 RepID=A0A9P7KCT7_9AGAR|nr:hypothetical protein DXG03_000796 [Asterophora parasitica]